MENDHRKFLEEVGCMMLFEEIICVDPDALCQLLEFLRDI